VIKYDRHETILEVATDSSSKVFATSTSTELNNAANA
jgi:hypothetical protein